MRTRLPDPADGWTDDDARVVLDEWRRSGETIAAFARKRGIGAARLYWWRKQLASALTAPTLSLVPATIVTHGTAITIRLPRDVTLEVTNASPSWVAAVVAELTRSA